MPKTPGTRDGVDTSGDSSQIHTVPWAMSPATLSASRGHDVTKFAGQFWGARSVHRSAHEEDEFGQFLSQPTTTQKKKSPKKGAKYKVIEKNNKGRGRRLSATIENKQEATPQDIRQSILVLQKRLNQEKFRRDESRLTPDPVPDSTRRDYCEQVAAHVSRDTVVQPASIPLHPHLVGLPTPTTFTHGPRNPVRDMVDRSIDGDTFTTILCKATKQAKRMWMRQLLYHYHNERWQRTLMQGVSNVQSMEQLIAFVEATVTTNLRCDRCILLCVDSNRKYIYNPHYPDVRVQKNSSVTGVLVGAFHKNTYEGATSCNYHSLQGRLSAADMTILAGVLGEEQQPIVQPPTTLLLTPIITPEDGITAVVVSVDKKGHTGGFTDEDEHIASVIAQQVGFGLAHQRLCKERLISEHRVDMLCDVTNEQPHNNLAPLVHAVGTKGKDIMGCDKCCIYIVDEELQQMWVPCVEGSEGITRFALTSCSIVNHVYEKNAIFLTNDIPNCIYFSPTIDRVAGTKLQTLLSAPLVGQNNGKVIGVVHFINKKGGFKEKADESLASAFTAHVSVALENTIMFHQSLTTARHLQASLDIALHVCCELHLDVVLPVLAKKIRSVVQAQRCSVLVFDGNTAEMFGSLSVIHKPIMDVRIPSNAGLVAYVLQHKLSLRIADCATDHRYNDEPLDQLTGSASSTMAAVPIFDRRNNIIAIVIVSNKYSDAPPEIPPNATITEEQLLNNMVPTDVPLDGWQQFTFTDLKLLESLAGVVGISISNAQTHENVLEKRRQAEWSLDTTLRLHHQLDLPSLMQVVENKCKQMVNAEYCITFVVNTKTKQLQALSPDAQGITLPLGCDIAGHVALTGRQARLAHAPSDARFSPDIDTTLGRATTSVLCVPMLDRSGNPIGVIHATNKKSYSEFSNTDGCLLQRFATQCTPALDNSLQYKNLRDSKEKLEVLAEILAAFATQLDMSSLMQQVTECGKQLLQAEYCTLFLLTKDSTQLTTIPESGEPIVLDATQGFLGHVVSTRSTVNVADVQRDIRFDTQFDKKFGITTRNVVAAPVFKYTKHNRSAACKLESPMKPTDYREPSEAFNPEDINIVKIEDCQVLGVLHIVNKVEGVAFDEDDEQLLQTIAMHTGIAVDNCQIMEHALHNSNTLESILGSIGHVVLTVSPNGYLTHCNKDTQPSIGLDPVELHKRHFTKWYDTDTNQAFCTDLKRVIDSEIQVHVRDFEFQIPHPENMNTPRLVPTTPIHSKKLKSALINTTNTKNVRLLQTAPHFAQKRDAKPDMFQTVTYTITPLTDVRTGNNAGAVCVLENLSEAQKVKAAMGKYMSPMLADKILQEGGSQLSNHLLVSVVFVDIRKFTSLSEQLPINDVMMLLNEYFHYIGAAVSEEKGTLDKFIGDAVMSVFGIPFAKEDDAIRACRAGLKMAKNINEMNSYRSENNLPVINIGIGINTAMVLSGPIGNLHRVEYTVVGDGVNLASRVEGCTKVYGVTLLCTQYTIQHTYHKFEVREVDSIRVAGKTQPVTLYEILREEGDEHLNLNRQKALQCFTLGLNAYKKRKWDEAEQCFLQAKTIGMDGPGDVFLKRVQKFALQPPAKDWDGVWNFAMK